MSSCGFFHCCLSLLVSSLLCTVTLMPVLRTDGGKTGWVRKPLTYTPALSLCLSFSVSMSLAPWGALTAAVNNFLYVLLCDVGPFMNCYFWWNGIRCFFFWKSAMYDILVQYKAFSVTQFSQFGKECWILVFHPQTMCPFSFKEARISCFWRVEKVNARFMCLPKTKSLEN